MSIFEKNKVGVIHGRIRSYQDAIFLAFTFHAVWQCTVVICLSHE